MNIPQKLACYIVCAISALITACSQPQESQEGSSEAPSDSHSSLNTFEEEAERLAMTHFATRWLKVGDFWYSRDNLVSNFVCRKNVRSVATPGDYSNLIERGKYKQTEADRMNNVLWRGIVTFDWSAETRFQGTEWGKWQDPESEFERFRKEMHSLSYEYVDGQWKLIYSEGFDQTFAKPNLDEIPPRSF